MIRRNFLIGAASLITAPAIVRVERIMRVRPLPILGMRGTSPYGKGVFLFPTAGALTIFTEEVKKVQEGFPGWSWEPIYY